MIKKIISNSKAYQKYVMSKLKLEEIQKTQQIIALNDKVRGPLMDKYLPKNGVGAELGVLKGHFSRTLLKNTNAKKLHLIDPWYFLSAEWSWVGGNKSTIDAVIWILDEFKTEIENQKVFVHIQDDIDVLDSFDDNYLDWAYIDSSHSYGHTVKELNKLLTKVKPQGVICGDDWRPDPNHRHHGVFKAVNEFAKEHNYKILYSSEEDLQWFIQKRSD